MPSNESLNWTSAGTPAPTRYLAVGQESDDSDGSGELWVADWESLEEAAFYSISDLCGRSSLVYDFLPVNGDFFDSQPVNNECVAAAD